MMRCPQCDSSIEESSVMCRYCRSRVGNPAAVAAAPAGPAAAKPAFEVIDVPAQRAGRPWEVWVVMAVIALNILGNLTQGRFGGIWIGALILAGLFKQSNLAWWFVTITNVMVAMLLFVFARELGAEMIINAVSCLFVAGLMISCRVRGAYGTSMD